MPESERGAWEAHTQSLIRNKITRSTTTTTTRIIEERESLIKIELAFRNGDDGKGGR